MERTSTNFQAYGKYYDLLYKDKNYNAEAEYVFDLIKKYDPEAKHILELGSGTGKHARLLAEQGFKIHGIERSSEMVEIAQKLPSENISYEINDISSFSLADQFDVAISLFHVISYLTDNADLLAAFANVERHLKPGGVFIFDVWYSPAVYHQKPETRVKRLSDDTVNIVRIAEPVIHHRVNIIDVNYEIIIENKADSNIRIFNEKHPMRHFSEPEIALLASAVGLQVISAEEFMTGETPGENTWGVCFILQKQNHV
ncbi:class I SAM-dependent DNA methyltransferase [Flavitalea antarctica]